MPKIKRIGILTSGGDCPGLNAAIRAVVRTVTREDVEVVGILDGFSGLIEKRTIPLESKDVSGLLTTGGTILGTSRHKPHKYPLSSGEQVDMTETAAANYHALRLDALVCLGGGGTQKNAFRLMEKTDLKIVSLPKTIDNDIHGTDYSFGFDTAMTIACEAMDRLHTTASSHQRVMLVDIMGHRAGWLALEAGLAAGADVILIPEIPFRLSKIIKALEERTRLHKRFSIVAVAEGAASLDDSVPRAKEEKEKKKDKTKSDKDDWLMEMPLSLRLAQLIEKAVGLETRVTTLGHLQRGGTPTPTDRVLATLLGAKAGECLLRGEHGVMISYRNGQAIPIPLGEIAGRKKLVTMDDPLIQSARQLGVCLGD